jgi:hypothetical protein
MPRKAFKAHPSRGEIKDKLAIKSNLKIKSTMPSFTLAPLAITDGPAMAQKNLSAFWTNQNWRLMWTRADKTLPWVISQSALRQADNLLRDPARRRHVKAVDENGQLVGYIRWILPERVAPDLWPEARFDVESLSEEELARIKADADSSNFEYNHDIDHLDEEQHELKISLMKDKVYLRK